VTPVTPAAPAPVPDPAEIADPVAAAAASIRAHHPEFAALPAPEWQHLLGLLRPRRFARGDALQRQGEPADRVFYLVQGVVCLRTLRDGAAVNLGFDNEHRWVGAYAELLGGGVSRFGVIALEPCTTVQLLGTDLRALYERAPCWDRVGRLMAERNLRNRVRKEHEQRVESPAERYERALRERRWFVDRVPQYELARFLGIAPETLSRIRARRRDGAGS
jgi:CRP/FNR family transcriptional regulator, anaerobic regulatory protein